MENQTQQPNRQPNQSQTPSDEQKREKNKRIAIILFALAAVVLVGGILLLQQAGLRPSSPTPVAQTPPPAPSPQPQTNDTSDFTLSEVEGWQTYRNEELGFEFEYPESEVRNSSLNIQEQNFGIYPGIYIGGFDSRCSLSVYKGPEGDRLDPFRYGRWVGESRFYVASDTQEGNGFTLHFGVAKSGESISPEECQALWEQIFKTVQLTGTGSPSDIVYMLASPDGFSLDIYKDGDLYVQVSQAQIEEEYAKKYPESSFDSQAFPGFRYLGTTQGFFWDDKRGNLIFPISFGQLSGSSDIWEFFIFDIDSKDFFITPEEKSFPRGGIVPQEFKVSPDGNKLAYVSGGAGGTCTLHQFPAFIDLATFDSVKLDDSAIQEARDRNPQIREGDSYQGVKEIQWVSNEQIMATMVLGCDSSVEEDIIFRVMN